MTNLERHSSVKWIDLSEKTPQIGTEVLVRTIYDFVDTGYWDGIKWIDKFGKFKGVASEAPKWALYSQEEY